MLSSRRLSDDPETARDITQEAWIAVARALPGLRDEGAFLAFALRIVTRQAAREVKRRQRRRAADGAWCYFMPPPAVLSSLRTASKGRADAPQ